MPKRTHRVFSQNSPSLPQNSVSSLFRNSILETVFRPFPSDFSLATQGKWPLAGDSLQNGHFPCVAWENRMSQGRKPRGASLMCAFGPQGALYRKYGVMLWPKRKHMKTGFELHCGHGCAGVNARIFQRREPLRADFWEGDATKHSSVKNRVFR